MGSVIQIWESVSGTADEDFSLVLTIPYTSPWEASIPLVVGQTSYFRSRRYNSWPPAFSAWSTIIKEGPMQHVICTNYSQFADAVTGVEFRPVVAASNGALVGHALTNANFAGRAGFRVLTEAEYTLLVTGDTIQDSPTQVSDLIAAIDGQVSALGTANGVAAEALGAASSQAEASAACTTLEAAVTAACTTLEAAVAGS